MIRIKDGAEPEYLSSQKVMDSLKDIRIQVASDVAKLDIPSHWGDKVVANTTKNDLFKMHSGKCCYCERRRTPTREMDVEHYRPQKKVTGVNHHRGYWWLSYVWSNYLWSCKTCNQASKGNQFPLLARGVRAVDEGDPLELEHPCLVNPRFEEPREYFEYYKRNLGERWLAKIIPLHDLDDSRRQRAAESIEILGLNRTNEGDDLVTERGESLNPHFEYLAYALKSAMYGLEMAPDIEVIEFYTKRISRFRTQISTYIQDGKEFAGFRRYFLSEMGIDYSELI